MTTLEAVAEIEELCRAVRDLLESPPRATHGGRLVPEADREDMRAGHVVLHFTRIRKLAARMSVQIAEEVPS